MKTAGRENPKRWATMPRNREHGAAGQNRSCSIQWAAKQENFQPAQKCFFLTSSFIELTGKVRAGIRLTSPSGVEPEKLSHCLLLPCIATMRNPISTANRTLLMHLTVSSKDNRVCTWMTSLTLYQACIKGAFTDKRISASV